MDAVKALLAADADAAVITSVSDLPALAAANRVAGKVRDQVLTAFQGDQPLGTSWQPSPAEVQAAVRAAKNPPPGAGSDAVGRLDDFGFPIDQDLGVLGAPSPEDGAAEQDAEDAYDNSFPNLVYRKGGLTALLHAVREGHIETALALIDAGDDINQPSAGDHTSPLLMATINGQFDLAMTLLERGADPDVASDAGATALFAAINTRWAPKARYPQQEAYKQQETTHDQLVKALLDLGVDPNVRLTKHLWYMEYTFSHLGIDTRGATPFWRATHALDLPAMKMLVEYGADPEIPTLKPPPRRSRRDEPPKEDQSGLPPVPVGGPGVWPIHAAAGHGYGIGYAGNSHRHVPEGWIPAMRYLVDELGADVNARDHDGFSPLHDAAARGDNEMIRFLVDRGADVTVVNRAGQTTADMANGPQQRTQPFNDTVELLESLGSTNNHHCVSC